MNTSIAPSSRQRTNSFVMRGMISKKNDLDHLRSFREAERKSDDRARERSLTELLACHNRLLHKLANGIHECYSQVGEYDDFYLRAVMGAIDAYGSYDLIRQPAKLATWVRFKVYHSLLDQVDNEGFIRTHPKNRAIRNYLSGKFEDDPVQKEKIESHYNIDSPEAYLAAQRKYGPLRASFFSLYDSSSGEEDSETFAELLASEDWDEQGVVERLELERAVGMLTERQQTVCYYVFFEGNTSEETATKMGLPLPTVRGVVADLGRQLRILHACFCDGLGEDEAAEALDTTPRVVRGVLKRAAKNAPVRSNFE